MAVPQLLSTGWPTHSWSEQIPIQLDSADLFTTSAGGAAVTLTLPTPDDANTGYLINQIIWSYSAAPAAATANLRINDGTNDFNFDLSTTAGLQNLFVFQPWQTKKGVSVAITLGAGGGAVVGKIYVFAQLFRG